MKTNWRKLILNIAFFLIDYLVKHAPEIKQELKNRIDKDG